MGKKQKVTSLLEGDNAPDFILSNQDEEPFQLYKTKASYIVIFFYPKDSTPGCTIEAREFSKNLAKFAQQDTLVIGISGGTIESKQKFCSRFKLKCTLLNDPEFSVSKSFGVYGPKKFMGKTYQGISRTTFVLDKSKKIIKIFEKVKPLGHSLEVLDFLERRL